MRQEEEEGQGRKGAVRVRGRGRDRPAKRPRKAQRVDQMRANVVQPSQPWPARTKGARRRKEEDLEWWRSR